MLSFSGLMGLKQFHGEEVLAMQEALLLLLLLFDQ